MYDINSEIETLEELVEELKGSLPYGINDISDLGKIRFDYDAIYCRWNNATFESEDAADEFFKEEEGAFYAARNGYLTYEDAPTAWNDDYSIEDGENFTDKAALRSFENAVNNLIEWCDEVSEGISIDEVPFEELIEEARIRMTEANAEELEEELRIKAKEKKEILNKVADGKTKASKKQEISKI